MRTRILGVALVFGLVFCQFARAADSYAEPSAPKTGFYAGADLGAWMAHQNIPALTSGSYSIDLNGLAYRLFAGYQIARFVAVEAGYSNEGHATTTIHDPVLGGIGVGLRGNTYEGSVIGMLPLSSTGGLLARVGYMNWHDEADATYAPLGLDLRAREHHSNVVYGVGFYLSTYGTATFRMQYERARVAGVNLERIMVGGYFTF